MISLADILYATAALVVLTNPVTELPVFLAIMSDRSIKEKIRGALRVALAVWFILSVFALGGLKLLAIFGIELPAFRAAGGLLLIMMGIEMTFGREAMLQSAGRRQEDPDEALWMPLIMPMLAGPGAIVTTVSLTIRDVRFLGWIPLATITAITISSVVILLVLSLAGFLSALISGQAQRILTRFAGLVLVAIGFQMGFTGTAEFFTARG